MDISDKIRDLIKQRADELHIKSVESPGHALLTLALTDRQFCERADEYSRYLGGDGAVALRGVDCDDHHTLTRMQPLVGGEPCPDCGG